jgi:hypothetical protein
MNRKRTKWKKKPGTYGNGLILCCLSGRLKDLPQIIMIIIG